MKQKFRNIRLSKSNKERLNQINTIIVEYQQQGYKLTLRQLYYQLVSRDFIPNESKEYAKLSKILTEGRMAGIVDWDAIEDRVRVPKKLSSFDSPKEILQAAHNQYRRNKMESQDVYIEVWVEKDALSGVLTRITNKYGISILVNRGYSSVSAMYDSFERFKEAIQKEQSVHILYLGDHDPSGIDMIRDIKTRIGEFLINDEDLKYDWDMEYVLETRMSVTPVALTWEQIKQYNPPPNPAKISDPRAKDYIKKHGEYSWEVDALKPETLNQLLEDEILSLINMERYESILEQESTEKSKLKSFINLF